MICQSKQSATVVTFEIVPLKSLSVLQNLPPTWANMKTYRESNAKFFYFVSRET